MSADASWALQQALYTLLSADDGLLALLGGPEIHDAVPQGAKLPYIVIGDTEVRDVAADGVALEAHDLTIAVWSAAEGRREVKEIMEALRAALSGFLPELEGHTLIDFRFRRAELRLAEKNTRRTGRLIYRALVAAD